MKTLADLKLVEQAEWPYVGGVTLYTFESAGNSIDEVIVTRHQQSDATGKTTKPKLVTGKQRNTALGLSKIKFRLLSK